MHLFNHQLFYSCCVSSVECRKKRSGSDPVRFQHQDWLSSFPVALILVHFSSLNRFDWFWVDSESNHFLVRVTHFQVDETWDEWFILMQFPVENDFDWVDSMNQYVFWVELTHEWGCESECRVLACIKNRSEDENTPPGFCSVGINCVNLEAPWVCVVSCVSGERETPTQEYILNNSAVDATSTYTNHTGHLRSFHTRC